MTAHSKFSNQYRKGVKLTTRRDWVIWEIMIASRLRYGIDATLRNAPRILRACKSMEQEVSA